MIRPHTLLVLTIVAGLTGCDQVPSSPTTGFRAGHATNRARMTLNTHAWIPASARDIHEFEDDGRPYTNSYGFQSQLTDLGLPHTEYGPISSPVGVEPPSGVPSINLLPSADLAVEVHGPNSQEPTLLTGADLVGLELTFTMTDPADSEYQVTLEVIRHALDDEAGDLFEFNRIDPVTGRSAPLCEVSEDFGRFSRVFDGLHVEGETGAIVTGDPGLRHIGCLSAAPAKAMELGYSPAVEEHDVFVMATRVVRADYCADGHPYTYPGNLFDTDDNLRGPATLTDVQDDLPDGDIVEAVWDEFGVLCVDTPRAVNTSRGDIVCPTKHFADGTVAHNWQPPRCDGFVDVNPDNDPRIYSVTRIDG